MSSTIMVRVTRPRPEKIKSGSKNWIGFLVKQTIGNFFGEQRGEAHCQNVLSNVCVSTGLVLLPQCIVVLKFDLVLK